MIWQGIPIHRTCRRKPPRPPEGLPFPPDGWSTSPKPAGDGGRQWECIAVARPLDEDEAHLVYTTVMRAGE